MHTRDGCAASGSRPGSLRSTLCGVCVCFRPSHPDPLSHPHPSPSHSPACRIAYRYFGSKSDGVPKGTVAVRDCLAVSAVPPGEVSSRQYCFKLITPKRDYLFQVSGESSVMAPGKGLHATLGFPPHIAMWCILPALSFHMPGNGVNGCWPTLPSKASSDVFFGGV